jgi:hypothetical protein
MTAAPPASAIAVIAFLIGTLGCATEADSGHATIEEATVRVRAQGCGPRVELGTGTSIDDGVVVTAAHVVAGATQIDVVDSAGTTIGAEVVWFDPGLDVAALRPAAAAGPPVPLRSEPARPGDVGVVGLIADDGSVELTEVDVVQRVTIRTTDILREKDVERPGLRVAIAVEPGDSGAMVHLPDGGVGIVWSRSTTHDDQAWTVDVPTDLRDAATRRTLIEPVDVGPCR